jgi:hypothetical protein
MSQQALLLRRATSTSAAPERENNGLEGAAGGYPEVAQVAQCTDFDDCHCDALLPDACLERECLPMPDISALWY